ncbi:MAG: hypothetical protein Kow0037_14010 [Calditrichia bacterium]
MNGFNQAKFRIYLSFLFVISIFLSLPLTQIAAVLLLALSAFAHRQRLFSQIPVLGYLLLLMLTSGIMAVFISPSPAVSAPALMRFVIPLGVFALWQTSREEKLRSWLILAVILAGTAAATLGIFNYLRGMQRTQGFFGGYFTLATQMTLAIPLTVVWLQKQKGQMRAWANLALFVQLLALWFTFTRSAFLGLMVGGAVVGMLEFVKSKATVSGKLKQVQLWWGIPLLLLMLILTSSDPRINPLAHPPTSGQAVTTQSADLSSGRGSIIRDALHILKEDFQEKRWGKLLLGHGLRSRLLLVESQYKSWESDFLEALMNQGMIGLLLTFAIYFWVLLILIRCWQRGDSSGELSGLSVALIAYGVMSLLTLQLQSLNGAAVFTFLVGLLFGRKECAP